MVYEINTYSEFEEFIKKEEKVIVDAFATWCGPCKMLAPVMENASSARPRIVFGKVDIDKVQEVSEQYGISSIPTILFFENGKLKKDSLGYMDQNSLLKLIDSVY